MNFLRGYLLMVGLLLGSALAATVAAAESIQLVGDVRSDGSAPLPSYRSSPHGDPYSNARTVDLQAVKLAPDHLDTLPNQYDWGSRGDPYHTWPGYQAK